MQTQGHTKYVCIYSSCAINLYKTNLFLFVPKLIQYGIFPFMQKYVYKYKTNIRPTYLSIYLFFYLFIYLYVCPWPAAKFAVNKKDKGSYSESYFWARQRNWQLQLPMPSHKNKDLEKKLKCILILYVQLELNSKKANHFQSIIHLLEATINDICRMKYW